MDPINIDKLVRRPVVAVMGAHPADFADLSEQLARHATLIIEPDRSDLARVDAALAWQDTHLDRELLSLAPRLAVVTHLGTAVHVDVDVASELGIVVLGNAGHNGISVAEHTIGLLLALAKRILRSDRIVRTRTDWLVGTPELVNQELYDKTLGLLGFGFVGRHVARIAGAGLGMNVIVFEKFEETVREAGYEPVGLDELLERADVVSVHLPLTPETHHLLDERRFAQMKSTALLVHTARGEVVDYDALNAALRNGTIAGAAFDTWPHHRANPDSPLIDLKNVVMTQHNAGLTQESAQRMADAVVNGIWEVLADQKPTASHMLNPEVWNRRRRLGHNDGKS